MLRLTDTEWQSLKSQIAPSNWGGTRKPPKVLTEQGLAMLSGVLNSDRAILVNIQIMRVFTKIRQMLTENMDLRLAIQSIEQKTSGNTQSI